MRSPLAEGCNLCRLTPVISRVRSGILASELKNPIFPGSADVVMQQMANRNFRAP